MSGKTRKSFTEISLIKSLAASWSSNLIAAVDVKDTIHIWNVESFTKLGEVPSFPKAPDVRVALSGGAEFLYAGSWYAGGVMAYAISEGCELWRRADLRRFQGLCAEGPSSHLYCWFDSKATLRLDPTSGKTIGRLPGAGEVYLNPFGGLILLAGGDLCFGPQSSTEKFRVPRTTFAVLDVAFGPDCVAVSESAGPVRCFSAETGAELWRHTPCAGRHLIHLSFHASLDVFAGIEWAYQAGGDCRLIHLSRASGAISCIADITPARDISFCRNGSILINSAGDVIDVSSGTTIHRLDFPREEFDEAEFPSWEERLRAGTPAQRELARLLGPPNPP